PLLQHHRDRMHLGDRVVRGEPAGGLKPNKESSPRIGGLVSSPKRLARIAGFLYLLNAIASGFAFAYVLGKVFVSGNAAATAANVVSNPGLVRAGAVADLFNGTEWAVLAMAVYLLLRHVQKNAATAMVV